MKRVVQLAADQVLLAEADVMQDQIRKRRPGKWWLYCGDRREFSMEKIGL
jgi:hypothetical protein